MKAGVIVFPASNCDRDVAVALEPDRVRVAAPVAELEPNTTKCALLSPTISRQVNKMRRLMRQLE